MSVLFSRSYRSTRNNLPVFKSDEQRQAFLNTVLLPAKADVEQKITLLKRFIRTTPSDRHTALTKAA